MISIMSFKQARNIKNKPTVNHDRHSSRIAAMQTEIQALRDELQRHQLGTATTHRVSEGSKQLFVHVIFDLLKKSMKPVYKHVPYLIVFSHANSHGCNQTIICFCIMHSLLHDIFTTKRYLCVICGLLLQI